MARERFWVDEKIKVCNLCDTEFVSGQTMYDAKVIGSRWAYLCPGCQRTSTMAGRMGQDNTMSCIKYTYQPGGVK